MTQKTIKSKGKSHGKDFIKIMKGAGQSPFHNQNPQWTQKDDFFVKFSLYDENTQSIATTNTSLIS